MYNSLSPRDPENKTHVSILSWPLLPSWVLYPPAVYSSPLMTMASTLDIFISMLLGFPLSSRAPFLCAPLPTASPSRRPVPSSQPRHPRHRGGDQHLCHALFEVQKSGEVLLSPQSIWASHPSLSLLASPVLRNEFWDSIFPSSSGREGHGWTVHLHPKPRS